MYRKCIHNVDMPACLPANCNVMTGNDQSHCHWGRLAAGWRGGHQTQSELYWRTITNNTDWILHCGYKLGHEDTWILSLPFTIDILRRTVKGRNRKQSPTVPECCCLLLLSDRHLVLVRCDSIDLFINISLYYFSVTSNKQKCKLFRLFLLPPFQWPSS